MTAPRPGAGAAQQVSRMLALVPYISRRPGISIAELAAEFDVTPEQINADLGLLMVCGEPGYYPNELIDVVFDDEDGAVSISYDAGLDRPVRLSPEEAVTLTVALRALGDLPDLVDPSAVHSALAKLEDAVGGPVPAVSVDADPTSPSLGIIRTALERQQRIWMRYYTASRDRLTEREVDPIRVLVVDGHAYLEGYCYLAEAVRRFRVDRMDEANLLPTAVQPPLWVDDGVPDRLFTPPKDASSVTVVLEPSASWVAEYYLVDDLDIDAEGRRTVCLHAADDEYLIRLALSLGAAARIVDRPDIADAVRDRARAALAGYAELPSADDSSGVDTDPLP